MAGNVREWVWNADGDRRYTLGGGWSDPTYLYTGPDALDPMDRSPILGLRCAALPDATPGGRLRRRPERRAGSVEGAPGRRQRLSHLQAGSSTTTRPTSARRWSRWTTAPSTGGGEGQLRGGLRRRAHPGTALPAQERDAAVPDRRLFPARRARSPCPRSTAWEAATSASWCGAGGRCCSPSTSGPTSAAGRGARGPNYVREVVTQRAQDVRRAIDFLESRAGRRPRAHRLLRPQHGSGRGHDRRRGGAPAAHPRPRGGGRSTTGCLPRWTGSTIAPRVRAAGADGQRPVRLHGALRDEPAAALPPPRDRRRRTRSTSSSTAATCPRGPTSCARRSTGWTAPGTRRHQPARALKNTRPFHPDELRASRAAAGARDRSGDPRDRRTRRASPAGAEPPLHRHRPRGRGRLRMHQGVQHRRGELHAVRLQSGKLRKLRLTRRIHSGERGGGSGGGGEAPSMSSVESSRSRKVTCAGCSRKRARSIATNFASSTSFWSPWGAASSGAGPAKPWMRLRLRARSTVPMEWSGPGLDPRLLPGLASRRGLDVLSGVRAALRDAPRRAAVVGAPGVHDQHLELPVVAPVEERPRGLDHRPVLRDSLSSYIRLSARRMSASLVVASDG